MRCKSGSRKRDLIDQKPPVLTNGEKTLPICTGRREPSPLLLIFHKWPAVLATFGAGLAAAWLGALLDRILQEDPKNAAAQETMGFLEFRQGHLEEARNA